MNTNNKNSSQLNFLRNINDLIPPTSSLVNELCDLLEISIDSAYRRMRGETSLSMDEIITLCNHFKISFDSFTAAEQGVVTFNYSIINKDESHFIGYLNSLKNDLEKINAAKDKLIVYACEDIPVFQNYNYPDLAAFKIFYWMKSIMNLESLENEKFDIAKTSTELQEIGKAIFELYKQIPSIEIWTDHTIFSSVKQIEYYWESGMFHTKEDALSVCNSLKEQIKDIQKQAETGNKNAKPSSFGQSNNYTLYQSDIEITNNCVFVGINDMKAVYLGHQSFNTMSTSNKRYCEETESWMNNLIRKSTLISGVSEKQRNQFFRKNLKIVDELIERVNNN